MICSAFLPAYSNCEPLGDAVEKHNLLPHVEAAAEEGSQEPLRKECLGRPVQNQEIPDDQGHAEQTQQSVVPAVAGF